MKLTIKEYYETLKAKRENNEREMNVIEDMVKHGKLDKAIAEQRKQVIFRGIDTYTDCICLLESSHLLDVDPEDEKQNKAAAFDIIKKIFDLEFNGKVIDFNSDRPVMTSVVVARNNDLDEDFGYCVSKDLTKEEYFILKKVGIEE